jgi:hypothetical protein
MDLDPDSCGTVRRVLGDWPRSKARISSAAMDGVVVSDRVRSAAIGLPIRD